MKNFIKWLGIISMALVIGFSFAACDDGGGGGPGGPGNGGGGSNANVVGTWKGTYTEKISGLNMQTNMTYVFSTNGTFSCTTETAFIGISIPNETVDGTYYVSGNTVYVTNGSSGVTDTATVSGNTMTISVRSGINGPVIDTVTLRKN
jgi:hypothetical protein